MLHAAAVKDVSEEEAETWPASAQKNACVHQYQGKELVGIMRPAAKKRAFLSFDNSIFAPLFHALLPAQRRSLKSSDEKHTESKRMRTTYCRIINTDKS